MNRYIQIAVLTLLLGTPTMSYADVEKGTQECAIDKAVYKPHPSYREKDLKFTMTIEKPPSDRTTLRWNDYYIHTFLKGKEVSSYRMSMTCGNGVAGCYLGGSEFLELDQFLVEYKGQYAPYAYLISNIPQPGALLKSEHVKFFTKSHIIPDFTGLNLWVLDRCDN